MVIKPLDFLKHCYTNEDGAEVYGRIAPALKAGQNVVVSFEGIDAVPSSFVNSAFIELLHDLSFAQIKQQLSFIHSNKTIKLMIKSRFEFEVARAASTPLPTAQATRVA